MVKKSKDMKGGKGKGRKGMDEAEYIQNLEERILAEAPPPGTNPLAQDLAAESNEDGAGQAVKGGGRSSSGLQCAMITC